jgi:hypothetical protein
MTGQVQADESLKDYTPSGPCGGQKDQEAGGGAAIRHHVKNGAECGRLVIVSSGYTIESIKKVGY